MTSPAADRELRNLRALWLFLRRGVDVPGDGDAIHYSGQPRPIFWVFLVLNPVEILLVEFVVANTVVRVVLLVAAILGTVWYVALLTSLYKYPHAVDSSVLRLRHLSSFDWSIPLGKIESVSASVRWHEQTRTAGIVDDGLVLQLGKATNVSVLLNEPQEVDLGRFGRHPVSRIDFWADEHRDAVRLVRRRLDVG